TSENFKRKLAAILSADVKGYSRLMGEDEEHTIKTITDYRETISDIISKHKGRVVDSPGDNILAEFASALDVVNSAIEIQEKLAEKNAYLPDTRKMEFRNGINLGDIVQEGDRIYGDGVNIAARIEGLADPGGVCISRNVCDQVKKKLMNLGYKYIGAHDVKNISEPVRVYKILMEPQFAGKMIGEEKVEPKLGKRVALAVVFVLLLIVGGLLIWRTASPPVEVASVEKMAFPLHDKPSIAVLPFDNLSGDPEQEYFSDGITEDLITDLSKISGLFVIARNSVFTYKDRAVKITEVGRELGVRYVLEGSVRKANNRVRITAQLVNATTEGHLWAERYDRNLRDIFALQDEVTQKIVAALAVKLTEDEQKRLAHKYTDNMAAYDLVLQGKEYNNRFTKEANDQARQMYERAIELDPEFAFAYSLLSLTQFYEWSFGWSNDPRTLEQSFELAQKAIALDESLPLGHAMLGQVYLWKKQHDRAIAELENAIALSPNDAKSLAILAGILNWNGRPEEAIMWIRKAMTLNPMYPAWYLWNLGHSYFLLNQYEKAVEPLE
ncbi:MAG: adenylate/guanylate cyclase domain-containing protein, partial [Anaerolineales bacterium]